MPGTTDGNETGGATLSEATPVKAGAIAVACGVVFWAGQQLADIKHTGALNRLGIQSGNEATEKALERLREAMDASIETLRNDIEELRRNGLDDRWRKTDTKRLLRDLQAMNPDIKVPEID